MNFEVTVQSTVAANESARIEMVHTHVLTRQRLGTFRFAGTAAMAMCVGQ
jgi:hypothetical protein